jgi:hypothetical protein
LYGLKAVVKKKLHTGCAREVVPIVSVFMLPTVFSIPLKEVEPEVLVSSPGYPGMKRWKL